MSYTSISHLLKPKQKRSFKKTFLFSGVLFFSFLVVGLLILNVTIIQQPTRIVNRAQEKPINTPAKTSQIIPSTTITVIPTEAISSPTSSISISPTPILLAESNSNIAKSSCNTPCALNSDCPGSFICSEEFKKCRNPTCSEESDCTCKPSPTKTITPTNKPIVSINTTITASPSATLTIISTKKPLELPEAGNAVIPLLISSPFILILIGMLL